MIQGYNGSQLYAVYCYHHFYADTLPISVRLLSHLSLVHFPDTISSHLGCAAFPLTLLTRKHHTDFGTLNQRARGKTVSTDVEASSWHITERKTGSWWNRDIHRISNSEKNTWVSVFAYRVVLEGTNVEGRAFDFFLGKTVSWFYFYQQTCIIWSL